MSTFNVVICPIAMIPVAVAFYSSHAILQYDSLIVLCPHCKEEGVVICRIAMIYYCIMKNIKEIVFWVEPLKSVSQTQTETATVKTTQIEVSFIEKILYIHSLGKCNVILRYLFDIYV